MRPGPKKGHDFSVKQGDLKLIIEVHTPQMTGKKHTIIHDTIERKSKGVNIQTQVSEIVPYGFPDKKKDTFVGEAVSTTAGIKCGDKQFSHEHEHINILWLDYCDLFVWKFTLPEGVFTPIYQMSNSLLRSGHVWHALYSPKGTVVYDDLPIDGGGYQKYKMEFDGRFVLGAKIDFVISRTANYTVILENHRSEKKHPDSLYKDFFRLYDFRLDLAWMDWPLKGSLMSRVEKALKEHRNINNPLTNNLCFFEFPIPGHHA